MDGGAWSEHAHRPIPWVSTPSGQPPLSQLRRPLPRPPLMSQVSPLTGVGTRSPSGVCAVLFLHHNLQCGFQLLTNDS